MLQNTVLRSPVSGIVTAKNYDDGDVTSPQLPIAVVEQINPVKLEINVSEKYFSKLKKKMPVKVTVEALDNREFEGYVSLIHPTVDPMSHTVTAEIEISNRDGVIRPGMYAYAQINFGSYDAVLAPESAIMKQIGAGQRYVFIVENNALKYREVELGILQGNFCEIKKGLQPGDVLVSGNKAGLTDGMKVQIK